MYPIRQPVTHLGGGEWWREHWHHVAIAALVAIALGLSWHWAHP